MEGSTGDGESGWFATDDVVAYETVPHPDLGQWAESFRFVLSWEIVFANLTKQDQGRARKRR